MPAARAFSYAPRVPGDVLTLLCGRCASVRRIELSGLERVPMWLEMLAEAFRDAGVRAIRVQTCDGCLDLRDVRGADGVLSELKRRIEGR